MEREEGRYEGTIDGGVCSGIHLLHFPAPGLLVINPGISRPGPRCVRTGSHGNGNGRKWEPGMREKEARMGRGRSEDDEKGGHKNGTDNVHKNMNGKDDENRILKWS